IGVAGVTDFTLSAAGYTDEADDLPLTYGFSITKAGEETRTWLTRDFSLSSELITSLPQGSTTNEFLLTVTAHVRDARGAESKAATQEVRVTRLSGADSLSQMAGSLMEISDGSADLSGDSIIKALSFAENLSTITTDLTGESLEEAR
ncbi:unnamed protein product, partial [Chrysoparadoxa australica]